MGSTSKDASAGSGDARCCDWQGCRNRASERERNGRENKGGDFVVVAEYLNPSICGHLDAGWCALLTTRHDRAAIFTDVPTGLCGTGMERREENVWETITGHRYRSPSVHRAKLGRGFHVCWRSKARTARNIHVYM